MISKIWLSSTRMSTLKLREKSFPQVLSSTPSTSSCYVSTHSYCNLSPTLLDLPIADPKKQLELAVKAVFNSWDSPRANKYRSINQITGLMGTAVNIQSMVFGNMGNTSGTGVLFTRNPSTGEKKLYGEFLINAQVIYDLITSFYLIFVNHAIIISTSSK
jgi:F0F1-type ATP synthase membrane subunit c/vacuolar-type H+-ATPase subunit K